MIDLQVFSQNDPRWQGKRLGTSNVTIGYQGCLLTCMAMVAKYYGHDTDPDRLNQALISNNGYLNGNLYKWYEGVPKIYNDIKCVKIVDTSTAAVTAAQFAEIDKELEAKRPVVIEVDFVPGGRPDMHFVVIVDGQNGEYTIADPWNGSVTNLRKYGEPKVTISRYVFHSGPIPQPPAPQPAQPVPPNTNPVITDLKTRVDLGTGQTDEEKIGIQELQAVQSIIIDYRRKIKSQDAEIAELKKNKELLEQVREYFRKLLGL